MYDMSLCKTPKWYTWNKDTVTTHCINKPYEYTKLVSGFLNKTN